MKNCASCQAEVLGGAKFCPNCGRAVDPAKDQASKDWLSLAIAVAVFAVLYLLMANPFGTDEGSAGRAADAELRRAENQDAVTPVAGPTEEELAAAAEKAEREAAAQAANERQKRIRAGFNARGEHWELRELIRHNLHDPKSYEHIETRYVDGGSEVLEVATRYRARNAFGALVVNTTLARVHIDGRVIEIVHSE